MSDPAISVLMTVFNAGRFLEPAIRSIASQAFTNFEFLIVDDASTDDSAQVAAGWAQRDPRIRVVANPANRGQTACLNQGLKLARAPWIARQDADDLSHGARLAEQYRFATVCPEVVLLGTCGRMIDENDRLVGLLDAPLDQEAITRTSPLLNPFMHTSVMFRAEVVRDEFGGFDERFAIVQDYALWTRVIARHPAANLPQRLVCYRHLTTSLSKAGRGRAFEEAAEVSALQAERVFGQPPDPEEIRLMNLFRQGLPPGDRQAFWEFHRRRFRGPGDLRRMTAMHHLKAAGAFASHGRKDLAVREVVAAFACAPIPTFHWLAERYFNA